MALHPQQSRNSMIRGGRAVHRDETQKKGDMFLDPHENLRLYGGASGRYLDLMDGEESENIHDEAAVAAAVEDVSYSPRALSPLALSDCPVENGVVFTSYGAVTIASVLAGIVSGLEPQTVSLANLASTSTRSNALKQAVSSRATAIDNRWAATLAGASPHTLYSQYSVVQQSSVCCFHPSVESDSQQSVVRQSLCTAKLSKNVALRSVEYHVTTGQTDCLRMRRTIVSPDLPVTHQGEPGSFPGRVTPGISHVGIVPDDAAGCRVFIGDHTFPPPFHSGAAPYSPQSPSSSLKTSLLRAAKISSLTRSPATIAATLFTLRLRNQARWRFVNTSGNLAEVALYQGPLGTMQVGAAGGWNNTQIPRWYFQRDASRSSSHLTDTEIRGCIDGECSHLISHFLRSASRSLITFRAARWPSKCTLYCNFEGLTLARNIQSWYQQVPELRLSEVLEMYYSQTGLFQTRFRGCKRKDNFFGVASSAEMVTQTSSFAVVLDPQSISPARLSYNAIWNYSQVASSQLMSYVPSGLVDQACSSDVLTTSNMAVDLLVVLDSSWDYSYITQLMA
ncbi:hypothetical protein PR048_013943 [Dryococelus australis]|uniref:Uncharacterized protein n=1 Tax=Dryococelus australis TaxID=614101 RepID=A0ABQ9HUI2_9NEOP|nr:hypothetical protein PR048_013943 [Dryococelus australis]